jgi:hypothetical protein
LPFAVACRSASRSIYDFLENYLKKLSILPKIRAFFAFMLKMLAGTAGAAGRLRSAQHQWS